MSPDKSEIILDQGRFTRRTITHQDLGSQDTILAGLVESKPVFIKNYAAMGTQAIRAVFNENNAILLTQVTELPMRVSLTLSPNTDKLQISNQVGSAAFGASQPMQRGDVIITDPWIIPANLFLCYYIMVYRIARVGTYGPSGTPYLVYYSPNKGEFYAPYYPNIFDDGRVCMGDAWEQAAGARSANAPLSDAFAKAVTSFFTSRMNSHLTSNRHIALYQKLIDTATGKHSWYQPNDLNKYGQLTSLSFLGNVKTLIGLT